MPVAWRWRRCEAFRCETHRWINHQKEREYGEPFRSLPFFFIRGCITESLLALLRPSSWTGRILIRWPGSCHQLRKPPWRKKERYYIDEFVFAMNGFILSMLFRICESWLLWNCFIHWLTIYFQDFIRKFFFLCVTMFPCILVGELVLSDFLFILTSSPYEQEIICIFLFFNSDNSKEPSYHWNFCGWWK